MKLEISEENSAHQSVLTRPACSADSHVFECVGMEEAGFLKYPIWWCSVCGTLRTGYYGDKLRKPNSPNISHSIHVVYIAGPFRGKDSYEMKRNIDKAEALALEVWRSGFTCICPHLNSGNFQGAAPDNVWLDGDIEILKRCDAMLLVPGWEKSTGSLKEKEIAIQFGIPVFETLEQLVYIAKSRMEL